MDIFIELVLLALGIAAVKLAHNFKAKPPCSEVLPMPMPQDERSRQTREGLLEIQRTYPGLPAIPNNPLEYSGYIEEIFKRIRMGSLSLTVAQQTHLQQQLNMLQGARLAGVQTQAQLEQALMDLTIQQQTLQKRAEHADAMQAKRNEADLLKVDLEIAEITSRIDDLKHHRQAAAPVPPPEI